MSQETICTPGLMIINRALGHTYQHNSINLELSYEQLKRSRTSSTGYTILAST